MVADRDYRPDDLLRAERLVAREKLGEMLVHRSNLAGSNSRGSLEFGAPIDESTDCSFEGGFAGRAIMPGMLMSDFHMEAFPEGLQVN